MSTIITLLCFILVLGVTVFIHELGHFLFAKKAGIYCYEFSLGMGPVLWKFNRKNDETTYAIRLFPIGGFVQMAGEAVDLDEDIPEDKRMQSKTWMQRFLTVSAGVLFNFLLALVIFFIVGMITGTDDQKAYVGSIGENFKVSSSNLQVGDQILKVNGKNSWSSNKTLLLLMVNSGKNLSLDVKHADGTKENIIIEPTLVKEVVDDNNNVIYEIVSEKTDDSEYKFGIGLKTKSTSVKVNSIKDFFSNVYHGVIYAFFSIYFIVGYIYNFFIIFY